MLFGRVEAWRLSISALFHRHIVLFVGAVRHIGGGDVGDHGQRGLQRFFQLALLRLAFLNVLLQPGHFRQQGRGLGFVLFRLGLADQLGGIVAAGLLDLQFRQHVAQGLVLFQQVVGRGGGVGQPAPRQTPDESVAAVANGPDVVHGNLL